VRNADNLAYSVRMANDEERPAEFVQSLERGLAVIRAFSAERPRMTLAELARETGMTRAAARRFLITLKHLGYVSSQGRTFELRPSVLQLGYAYLSSFSLTKIAQDHLEALAEELHESCSASVLDGDDIVYVARASTNRIMTIGLSVGTRLPAYCTSMGRILLAALPDEELDAYLDRVTLTPRTNFTITDVDEFRTELERVRSRGWSLLDQELEHGVRSISVGVHDVDGRTIAAINTSAHATRVSLKTLQTDCLSALRRSAREIDRDLAGKPH
jgi:IclR family transcriptional regulator, pca regulon regulatory protein